MGFKFFDAAAKEPSTFLNLRDVKERLFSEENWLGGRDSNPDKQIQSLRSYR